MYINIPMDYKEMKASVQRCDVIATVELSYEEFIEFRENLLCDRQFIREHKGKMFIDSSNTAHCLMVLCEDSNDGILVNSEGYDYARYFAYVPYARQIAVMIQYPQIKEAVDKMFSEQTAADNAGNYRILSDEEISVMCAKHILWLCDAGGEQADFSDCLLERRDFMHKNLNGAVFKNAKIVSSTFYDAELCFASFEGAEIDSCSFLECTAEEAVFKDALFISTELDGGQYAHSNFTDAVFRDSTLQGANLANCCIDGTDFGDADICFANLKNTSENEEEWAREDFSGPTL